MTVYTKPVRGLIPKVVAELALGALTELGVAMLSGVLRGPRAIQVNIEGHGL